MAARQQVLPALGSAKSFNLELDERNSAGVETGRQTAVLPRSTKSLVKFDQEALREASSAEHMERARATNFMAHSRFSSGNLLKDAEKAALEARNVSAPAKMKARKDSLAGLTKEERFAKRKASMTAGDSWADLHGTKDRPAKQFEREEQRLKYEKLMAEKSGGGTGGSTGGSAGSGSCGAGPSSEGRAEATKLEQMLAALTAEHEAEVAAEAEAEREALYDEGLYAV